MHETARGHILPAILLLALGLLGGCGTIEGLAAPEGDSLVAIGVCRDAEHITGKRHRGSSCMDLTDLFVPLYVIDFPLSLGLDLALLPVTIGCEVCRPRPTREEGAPVEKVPPPKDGK